MTSSTVATTPSQDTTTSTTLTINPVTGNFSSPTPVSATLTDTNTGEPVVNEPVTFTLNGSESCTATTDDNGDAIVRHHPDRTVEFVHLDGVLPG